MQIVLIGRLVSVATERRDRYNPARRLITIVATPNGNNGETTKIEVEVPDTFEWREWEERRLRVTIEADE